MVAAAAGAVLVGIPTGLVATKRTIDAHPPDRLLPPNSGLLWHRQNDMPSALRMTNVLTRNRQLLT
jgi:hypothetical protein